VNGEGAAVAPPTAGPGHVKTALRQPADILADQLLAAEAAGEDDPEDTASRYVGPTPAGTVRRVGQAPAGLVLRSDAHVELVHRHMALSLDVREQRPLACEVQTCGNIRQRQSYGSCDAVWRWNADTPELVSVAERPDLDQR
jgi:hypothetical protein